MFGKNRNKKVGLCLMVVMASLVLAAVWAVLATPETALADPPEGKGKDKDGGNEIPVGIAFDDADGDGIKSDGDSKKKVTAIVGRNFSIFLETNNSNKTTAGRTLWLDLSGGLGCVDSVSVDVSDGVGGAGDDSDGICDHCFEGVPDLPTERFGTLPSDQKFGYPDNAKLEIRGKDLDGLRVWDMVETNARLYFSVGGQSWVLHWGPYMLHDRWTYAPGTDPVTVFRSDNDTWVISSTGDSIACLYRDNNPPHRETEYHGQVRVPFGLTAVAINHEETVWGDEPHGIVMGDEPPVCVEP